MNVIMHPATRAYQEQLFRYGMAYESLTDFLDVAPIVKDIQKDVLLMRCASTVHPCISFLQALGCEDQIVGLRLHAAVKLSLHYTAGISATYAHTSLHGYLARAREYLCDPTATFLGNTRSLAQGVQQEADALLNKLRVTRIPPEVENFLERRLNFFVAQGALSQ